MIVHEPNPWALLSLFMATTRIPMAVWFHSDVVRPRLQYRLFYAPIARPHTSVPGDSSSRLPRWHRCRASSRGMPREHRSFRSASIPPRGRSLPRPVDAPEAPAARSGDRSCSFVGRLVAYKGVDVLIKAAAPLPVHVVVAGEGPMRAKWARRGCCKRRARHDRFSGRAARTTRRRRGCMRRMCSCCRPSHGPRHSGSCSSRRWRRYAGN